MQDEHETGGGDMLRPDGERLKEFLKGSEAVGQAGLLAKWKGKLSKKARDSSSR